MNRQPPSGTWVVIERGDNGFAAACGPLRVIASWGSGWDHVSVSRADRCPTWEEMHAVKAALFSPEECAVQYHPPQSRYVDCHPYCLHLWRPQRQQLPQPPLEYV
jgi:hypothetical protein